MKSFAVFAAVLAIATAAPQFNFGLSTLGFAHQPIISSPVLAQQHIVSSPVLARQAVVAAPVLARQTVVAAPVVTQQTVVSAPTSSQFHAQDELGQYSYGYADSNSAKSETKTADGITRGGYSYVDGNGLVQHVQYVSDANGFRVAATNLPVGPAAPAPVALAAAPVTFAAQTPVAFAHQAPVAFAAQALGGPVHIGALPLPVGDTPEVTAAKIQHAQAHAEALARASF